MHRMILGFMAALVSFALLPPNSVAQARPSRVWNVQTGAGSAGMTGEIGQAPNDKKAGVPNSVSTGAVQGDQASTATVAYVVTSSNAFGTIDLNTGKYTQIGQMGGLPGALGGLGTLDGKLYGGAIRTGVLYQVNPLNGSATSVGTGTISYFVTGSTTNGLYAVGQDMSLYFINAATGATTQIGPTGLTPSEVGGGSLSSGSGTLYMSVASNYRAELYSLNTATGAATRIGHIGSNTGAPPMVFENDTLYAAVNFPSQKICTLNTTTGAPTCLARASGVPGYFYGLAPAPLEPNIVKAVIRQGTSLTLPPGRMYLYGMVTGGAAPSSPFVAGEYAEAVNPAGKLAAALAYGTDDQNSYTTETAYRVVGGVSVAGSWDNFSAFHSSSPKSGAIVGNVEMARWPDQQSASVDFTVSSDSLVIIIALASSQQSISLQGVPNLQTDTVSSGAGTVAMTIAHASLRPGAYSVLEMSSTTVAGQDPEHMADLVGVFVFGSKGQPQAGEVTGFPYFGRMVTGGLPQTNRPPRNAGFYITLGQLLMEQKDLAGAEREFRQAVELDKKNSEALVQLGVVQSLRGAPDEALLTFLDGARINPNEVVFYLRAGGIYMNREDWDHAEQQYQKALEIQPDNPLASNYLAYVMLERGRNVDVAFMMAQTARRQLPGNPNAADTLGWAFYHKHCLHLGDRSIQGSGQAATGKPPLQLSLGTCLCQEWSSRAGSATTGPRGEAQAEFSGS